MSQLKSLTTVATLLALSISAAPVMAETTASTQDLSTNVQEGKCGSSKAKTAEGKCGSDKDKEAKCGSNKAKEGKCGSNKAKSKEGKCGSAKCGANKK